MENLVRRSFSLNLRLLQICGLYSEKELSNSQKTTIAIVYLLINSYIPVSGLIYLLLDRKSDPVRLGGDAFAVAQLTFMLFKFLPFITNRRDMKKCINFFESSGIVDDNNQKQIIEDCVRICRRNSRLFLTFIGIGCIFWPMIPLFSEEYTFPVDVWLPTDLTSRRDIFWVVYLHILVAYGGLATAAIDPLTGGLAYHAATQLKVLKNSLQHLDAFKGEDVYRRIRECVKHQVTIINFVEDFERCFSPVVFYQIAGSMLGICFCCFQLNMIQGSDRSVAEMGISLVSLMVFVAQIYFYCYYGTQLFEESNSITDAIYMGRWYNYDIKSRQALIVLMERSKRPLVVTAGKILALSLVTFSTTLKQSYSLLAVLNSQSARTSH